MTLQALNTDKASKMASLINIHAKEESKCQRVGMDETEDGLRGRPGVTDKTDGLASSTSLPAKEEKRHLRVCMDEAKDSQRGWPRFKESDNASCH